MASKTDNSTRNVIPDWKQFDKSFKSGELNGDNPKHKDIFFYPIDEYINAWKQEKNIAVAGDLISAAIMNGNTKNQNVKDAAVFVIERKDQCPSSLIDIANEFIPSNLTEKEKTTKNTTEKIEQILNKKNSYKAAINYFRGLIRKYPYNPIWYVELSRCFINLGLIEKATQAMEIALHLGHDSRFITRAASRLYLHIGDIDKAHHILTQNPAIKYDPWILASEIAVNSSRGRNSRFIKTGINMIQSDSFSPFSLTELSSAIGTKELETSKKKGKLFIEHSLIAPNDNSLAQADWLMNYDRSLSLNFKHFEKPMFNYESNARFAFMNDDYLCALNNAIDWIGIMPFARTPINFAADMAYTFLENYSDAIKILQIGLQANPNDASFLNNLAYAYALNNETDQADLTLKKLNATGINENEIAICATATNGLNEYRKGNINEGRKLYKIAIDKAKNNGNTNLAHKAMLNIIREEAYLTHSLKPEMQQIFDHLNTGNNQETEAMKKTIKKLLQ